MGNLFCFGFILYLEFGPVHRRVEITLCTHFVASVSHCSSIVAVSDSIVVSLGLKDSGISLIFCVG